ncbi:hypothetical protein [Microbacterium sp. zg.B185]|nr:hypothetical protein [Microbacterium sp. zg.B185]MCR2810038.1 hypothetical protein [Microbacterium sp. zg.B185]
MTKSHSGPPWAGRREIGPADLQLPPTQPFDVTALIAAALSAEHTAPEQ